MKPIVLILSLFYLNPIYLVAQKVTYKDLIGIWDTNDTTLRKPSTLLQFKDSKHVAWSVMPSGIDAYLNYTLDTLSVQTLIHLQGITRKNVKINMYWVIKISHSDTLRIQQGMNGIKPTTWNENKATNNTEILIRRKQN